MVIRGYRVRVAAGRGNHFGLAVAWSYHRGGLYWSPSRVGTHRSPLTLTVEFLLPFSYVEFYIDGPKEA